MSRRKKRHEHANHERWLVSYADFITLLFAFFVVLYASSQQDHKKAARVSAAIEGAFQELGVFSGSASGPIMRAEAAAPPNNNESAALPDLSNLVPKLGKDGSAGGSGPNLEQLRRELEEALGEEIKNHEIEMRVTPEGLVVSLREIGFFNSGDATLLAGGRSTLGRIAKALNKAGFQIRVEGHTDNVPIHTSRFKSNWELSTTRATEVVALLVEDYGFDPKQVSAAGYSQYRPLDSNDTEAGRKMNRRVDVVVVAHNPRSEQNSRSVQIGR
jgi:chemotaxis protein MotB